ncbi:MAG: hypothetical protein IKV46_03975 [Bacteroidales bacterium]|nr:hypothetical protein [Bacteroidales bacterium]
MINNKTVEEGSKIAKRGFEKEEYVVIKFNNWQQDLDAQQWLRLMSYNLKEIEYVRAEKIKGSYKSDVQVQVSIKLKSCIDVENLQVKLVSNEKGFNQIDKRWIDKYIELWNIPEEVSYLLKQYTGEVLPTRETKDKRRTFANEFNESEQKTLLNWFEENKIMIVSDILKGRGRFAAEWILVIREIRDSEEWVLKPINEAINFFGNGKVLITSRGNILIGKITMQRKGGDGGRDTARMLQFKINPAKLFNLSK